MIRSMRPGGMVDRAVHERGRVFQPSPYLKENIPSFRAMADAVHKAGGKIFGVAQAYVIGVGGAYTAAVTGAVTEQCEDNRTIGVKEKFDLKAKHVLETGTEDVEIPGESYTFTQLKHAQADGDLATLHSHGLPAARITLNGSDAAAALRDLTAKIKEMLS